MVPGYGATQMLGIPTLALGNRWKSSSVINGMNGDNNRNPKSKQV